MKILFVTNVMSQFMDFAPLGIMYLSAVAKKAGHETLVTDAEYSKILRACREEKPEVVAYSVTTGYHGYFLALNQKLKKALPGGFFAVFGGPHATYFPEMVKEEGVDAVFRGEGEEAFAEFLQAFPHREKLYRLRNCWVKDMADPARIHENPLRPLIDDLDLIPFPDRALISRYLRKPLGFHTFMSSRGCPYQCTYCFNAAYRALYQGLGKTLRKRSVGNLIEEISRVKSEFPLQHVSFQDDEFCGSLEWLKEFSAEYRRVIGVPFSCNFRPNLVTGEKVALLKEAGLSSASMAFEAGDPRVRNEILKRNLSQETMLHAAHTITSAGVFLTIQNILGIPGGSLEADLKTLDLNIAARPGYAWVSICAPYPGTELGTYARDRGYFDGTLDSLTPTYHFRSSLTIKHKREVENLHKLFAIVVEYPWLKPLARQLIRLPLTGVYNLARKFFKGWIYYRKNRFKMRFSLAEKLKYGLKFLTETGG